jgi:hypothetical protein
MPHGDSQAWKPRTRKIKMEANPRREDQQNKEQENELTFNSFFSTSSD